MFPCATAVRLAEKCRGGRMEQQEAMNDRVARLVVEVMAIERKFGHALRGADSDRREGVKEAIDTLVGDAA